MNFVSKNKQSLWFRYKYIIIILIVAAIIRFWRLADFPVHLGHDEVTQLYDAISIAQTGKDIYGNSYPFIFQSVSDFKPPFYTYATVVSYWLFGWNEVTIRIPGAFFGTLLVLAVYLFTKEFLDGKNKYLPYVAAILAAISPFEIFYSRKSFENQAGVFLMLLGFTFLLRYVKKKGHIKNFYLASVLLGIAAYIYFAQAVLVPLLLIAFIILFWKKLKPINLLPLVVFVLIISPLYYMIFVNPDTRSRSRNVFVTQDPALGKQLEGKGTVEKLWRIGFFAGTRYISQFNPKYLFLDGLDMTQGKRDVGPLFPVTAPFLLLGAYLLLKDKGNFKEKLFILAWILIGMIPSGLTFDKYSPHRAIMVFVMLDIVSAIGITWFIKRFGKIGIVFLILLFGANLAFFAKRYILNFPIERSEALHYPYEEVARYAWENHDKYDTIIFDPKFGEFYPWIGTGAHYYLAFYGNYPPQAFQREFKIGDQEVRETTFDKFSIRAVYWPKDRLRKNTLIIASPWSLPQDIQKNANIIKVFYFRTTAVAFYAIEL